MDTLHKGENDDDDDNDDDDNNNNNNNNGTHHKLYLLNCVIYTIVLSDTCVCEVMS